MSPFLFIRHILLVFLVVFSFVVCAEEDEYKERSKRQLLRRRPMLPSLTKTLGVGKIVGKIPIIGSSFQATFNLEETAAKYGIPENELADPETISSIFPTSITERIINRIIQMLTSFRLSLPVPISMSSIYFPKAPFQRFSSCGSKYFGTGHCRYFHHCLIPDLIFKPTLLVEHLCLVNNFIIGICCPDSSYIPRPPKRPIGGQTTNPTIYNISLPTTTSTTPKPITERPHPVTKPQPVEPPTHGPEEPDETEYDSGIAGCGLSFKTRIVGGRDADPEDWLWMAAILNKTKNNEHYCGGVLITKTHVLTAAHCMNDPAEAITVRVGEYDLGESDDTREQNYDVLQIIKHPQYHSRTQDNDIAILKLTQTVSFTTYVRPICMPVPTKDYFNEEGTVVGWGRLDYGGPVASVLQQVEIPVWNNTECTSVFRNVAKRIIPQHLCAGSRDGTRDSCSGDSGGPLMIPGPRNRWMVVGVVSFGLNCAEVGYPGVYTRVTEYMDWIYENIVDYGKLIDRRNLRS